MQKVPGKPRPHVIVSAAPKQPEGYSQFGQKVIVAKESGRSLKRWLLREEAKIDAKFKPKQSITGPDRTVIE